MTKLTAKQESFTLGLFAGLPEIHAHRDAYPNNLNDNARAVEACRLAKNPKIVARLAELRAPAAKAAQITLEGHLNALGGLRDAARAKGDLGSAIKAEIARGKHSGVAIEKSELNLKGGPLMQAVLNVTISPPPRR